MNTLGFQTQLPSSTLITDKQLGWFVLFALCLHIAMFSVWRTQTIISLPSATHSMRVSLQPAPASTTNPESRPATASQPPKKLPDQAVRRSAASKPAGMSGAPLNPAGQSDLQQSASDRTAPDIAELSQFGGRLSDIIAPSAVPTDRESTDSAVRPTNETDLLTIQAPPSGWMKMKLLYQSPGKNPVYGIGEIEWHTAGGQYQMRVEASLDLLLTSLRLYHSESRGRLGEHGITPEQMLEVRRGRDQSTTQFDYQQAQLQFSANHQSAVLQTGAQDRSTVFMQLAGLGLADPGNFKPGREIHIQVAEDRDANLFTFIVSGQEQIDSKLGPVQTWHLIRPPRPGVYNSSLEIWLAPDYQWYPVQIRNTESNGAITTQTVSEIHLNTSKEY